jgi:hypothetical protein
LASDHLSERLPAAPHTGFESAIGRETEKRLEKRMFQVFFESQRR